jgi:signal transduction histidine kinase
MSSGSHWLPIPLDRPSLDLHAHMLLAEFILHDMDAIVADWEAFAATRLPAAASMNSLALRDHAREILQAVAKDMGTSQSENAQLAKSLGQAPQANHPVETAAQTHAVLRAKSGFNINQLVAEYRALRASVLSLWIDAHGPADSNFIEVIRFNEAIDQAIAESVSFFSTQVEQARNLFLGMLGHDLRTPLQTIEMTATYLKGLNAGAGVSEGASRLVRSGARMRSLLDDLLDFNRTQLGLGINIVATDVNVADLFADELSQLRVAHPDRQIDLEVSGEVRGVWDGPRLQRMLGNLVVNAIKYGSSDIPVHVAVDGGEHELRFEVSNGGLAIDPAILPQIFQPLIRGVKSDDKEQEGASLGLGLHIAREIAEGHGGRIDARSDEVRTTFTVRLPRRGRPEPR